MNDETDCLASCSVLLGAHGGAAPALRTRLLSSILSFYVTERTTTIPRENVKIDLDSVRKSPF